ncbi:MAG TPA: RNase adapter RapZ [Puia sp.]|jgi:aminoglycoside/choline kinase family phosphotransferase|nr:RNase adapter RapZ [Puia sp.]
MQAIIEEIRRLFLSYSRYPLTGLDVIPQSGSNRIYFRIRTDERSYIATYNDNIRENRTFIYFSRHFRDRGCPVPEIYFVNEDCTVYFQEDFGDQSLLTELEKQGHNDAVYALFRQSLRQLAKLQIRGDEGLDYDRTITSREFGKQAILSDLLYFKYYFLDTLRIPYDKELLIDDFERLSAYLTRADHKYFLYRDFQSRNILLKDGQVHFIDFQGGMKGALQYDVASLLWQAKAELSDSWKDSLLDHYMDCVEEILEKKIDRASFVEQYNGYVLIRLLQVLGAYGFRGLFERKAHFLISIPLALRNLKWFVNHSRTGITLPEFDRLLELVVQDEQIHRFEPIQADQDTPLTVHIRSFSYRNAIPADESGNGGGFVFDCRGILNPGRIEEFRTQTGRDKPVKDFLEQQTRMPEFLNGAYNIVDISVEDYIKRRFSSLCISFGCTGGQHRSVYAADALARHLRNKYHVKIDLHHIEQEAKNWVN